MKKYVLCLSVFVAVLWIVGLSQVAAASGWTYPEEQAWQVTKGRPVAGVKVPADLAGIPVILQRTRLYFLPNAVVMPSVNLWGAFTVRPGCFRKSGSELTFYYLKDHLEKPGFVFRNMADGKMQLVMDGMFEFDLERIPLNAQAEEELLAARASYNQQAGFHDGEPGKKVIKECRVAALQPKHPRADQDLQVTYPGLKVSRIFSAHAPDPTTPIGMDSGQSLSYEPYTGAEIVVRGCRVKARHREARLSGGALYIMQAISGAAVDDTAPCSRVERVWTIDEAVVKVLLPVEQGFKPHLSFRHINKPREAGEYFFEIMAQGYRAEKKANERVFYIVRLGALDKESPTVELLETSSKCFWCR